jgi:hypothetical protein
MYYTIKNSEGIVVVYVSEEGLRLFIPSDPLNPDYLAYVAWLFEGNTPEQWQPESEPASEPVIDETPADSTEEEPMTQDAN